MVPLLQRVTLEKSPKVTKGLLPQHSVPRLGSACLLDGDPNVGGGLPPMRECQLMDLVLTHCNRGQVESSHRPSHIFNRVHQTQHRSALRPPRLGF